MDTNRHEGGARTRPQMTRISRIGERSPRRLGGAYRERTRGASSPKQSFSHSKGRRERREEDPQNELEKLATARTSAANRKRGSVAVADQLAAVGASSNRFDGTISKCEHDQ